MSNAQIAKLLEEGGRYQVSVLPDLEAHLQAQLDSGFCDLDANIAILKLYCLYPDETKVEVIEGILLKALMSFPATDFSLAMYMIPEKHHQTLRDVIHLAQQLEMAKFKTFWKEADGVTVLNKAKGWPAAVRSFIAGVISSGYRSIKVDQLCELLNLATEADLEPMIKEREWTRSPEDPKVIVVNSAHSFENVKVEVKAPTNMSLEQYRTLFMASNA
mmetsp:Transcript_69140/g.195904  ORF Transcript_69140/g.195904 Transcript_69140/m.195904 type:complete len:217 (+) Transcript_69140:83-733(+)